MAKTKKTKRTPTWGQAYTQAEDGFTLALSDSAEMQAFAAKHGRTWKAKLSVLWASGKDDTPTGWMRRVRNSVGPSGLEGFPIDAAKPPAKALPKMKATTLYARLNDLEDRLLEIQTGVADLSENKGVDSDVRVDLRRAYEAIMKASNALLDVRGDGED